jgi:hypothetical protein
MRTIDFSGEPSIFHGEGPAVLRLRLREIEIALYGKRLAEDARRDVIALIKILRSEALGRQHETIGDLAAKLRLIGEGSKATIYQEPRRDSEMQKSRNELIGCLT